jgi:hypothetical protein
MKHTRVLAAFLAVSFFAVAAAGQRPEVSISLNEAFFDSLLDAIYQNSPPIEFSIASNHTGRQNIVPAGLGLAPAGACKEVIQLLRGNNGVRTAVRFRDGKISAPLAFTGNYNPPFVGCVPFSGLAESMIDLEFDQQNQRLIARARVLNVVLNGTGGVGGTVIAKMVQGSIDRKVNPIEIFRMEKLSFPIPIQNAGGLRMKATGVRHDVEAGVLRIHIAYEFTK